MINYCLQINLNCCKAAQALLYQTAAERSVDFIFVSELNSPEGPNWYTDSNKKAAIVNIKSAQIEDLGSGEPDFRWITISGTRVYSY